MFSWHHVVIDDVSQIVLLDMQICEISMKKNENLDSQNGS